MFFQSMAPIISESRFYCNRFAYPFVYQNADMNTFGKRLREARKAVGLSQKDVAKRTDVSQPLLSELENGHYQTSGYVFQLAHLYKVSARWLAEGKGPREISAVELLDDPEMEKMLRRYGQSNEATQALVAHLLREPGQSKPAWMTDGTAAAIENARLLVAEQISADVKKV